MLQPSLQHVKCPDAANGHHMAYWQWGQPNADHVILCVHGLTRQGRDFDVLARALCDHNEHPTRVVCPDVVGRGQSDWLADPMAYALPTYASDMKALVAQLHSQCAIRTLDWVGTSMGGLIGMMVAGTPDWLAPNNIRKLVLNDIGPTIDWPGLQRIASYVGNTGQFASEQAGADAMWAISSSFGPHTPEQWLALSRPMLKPSGTGWTLHYDPAIGVPMKALTADTAAQGEAIMWKLYDNIQAQTLVVRGANSDILTAATAQAMAERGPRASIHAFAGVGHAPTLIAQDQTDTVVSFLLGMD